MIIPPRCFTCGTVIGDKWIPFIESILEEKQKSDEVVEKDDKRFSFKGRKKFKKRQRPKKFSFKKHKKK